MSVFTNNAKTRVIWLQEVISVHEVLEANYPIFLMDWLPVNFEENIP